MRHHLLSKAAVALGAIVMTTFAVQEDARACGGCFGPPPPPQENPTVVTDHRAHVRILPEHADTLGSRRRPRER